MGIKLVERYIYLFMYAECLDFKSFCSNNVYFVLFVELQALFEIYLIYFLSVLYLPILSQC